MVTRGSRGRGFDETRKKSSSGGRIALLFLLLLGSVGYSIYLYQENTRTEGISSTLKVQNADLSSQARSSIDRISTLENQIKENQYFTDALEYEFGLLDKEKTVLEKDNRELIEKNNELENQIQILRLSLNNNTPKTDGQINNQNEPNEITLLLNSIKNERDELASKAVALETIINTKNSEILNLQIQLAQSNDQFAVLSNEVNDLKNRLSIPEIFTNPPRPQTIDNCVNTSAKLLKRPAPIYPRRALDRGIQGTVQVELDVSTSGKPINITDISNANGILASAAIRAAEKMEFQPAEDCNGNFIIDKGVRSSYKFALE